MDDPRAQPAVLRAIEKNTMQVVVRARSGSSSTVHPADGVGPPPVEAGRAILLRASRGERPREDPMTELLLTVLAEALGAALVALLVTGARRLLDAQLT
jgi:hypothetical protein